MEAKCGMSVPNSLCFPRVSVGDLAGGVMCLTHFNTNQSHHRQVSAMNRERAVGQSGADLCDSRPPSNLLAHVAQEKEFGGRRVGLVGWGLQWWICPGPWTWGTRGVVPGPTPS